MGQRSVLTWPEPEMGRNRGLVKRFSYSLYVSVYHCTRRALISTVSSQAFDIDGVRVRNRDNQALNKKHRTALANANANVWGQCLRQTHSECFFFLPPQPFPVAKLHGLDKRQRPPVCWRVLECPTDTLL